jgi:hypothetical protein
MFALAYAGFGLANASVAVVALPFIAAGVGISAVETAEHAAVAALATDNTRGSAFGVLAPIQALGDVAASAVAGILRTVVSPGRSVRLPHRLDVHRPRRPRHQRPPSTDRPVAFGHPLIVANPTRAQSVCPKVVAQRPRGRAERGRLADLLSGDGSPVPGWVG